MKKFTLILLAVMLVCAGCANQSGLNKGTQGAGIGAVGGAVIGQAIGRSPQATLIGVAVGTMLGYIVGNEMDKFDRQQLNSVYESAPSGRASTWHNPDNGNSYQVTPQPAYYPPSEPESPCRKAEILATIDGRTQKTYTTACRNRQGEWELQNN